MLDPADSGVDRDRESDDTMESSRGKETEMETVIIKKRNRESKKETWMGWGSQIENGHGEKWRKGRGEKHGLVQPKSPIPRQDEKREEKRRKTAQAPKRKKKKKRKETNRKEKKR
jgi:hypothetical protein